MNINNGGALRSIDSQKRAHQQSFHNTKNQRKTWMDGGVSVAAERGLIKNWSRTSGLAYNSKMKTLNNKMSLQIMNKYRSWNIGDHLTMRRNSSMPKDIGSLVSPNPSPCSSTHIPNLGRSTTERNIFEW